MRTLIWLPLLVACTAAPTDPFTLAPPSGEDAQPPRIVFDHPVDLYTTEHATLSGFTVDNQATPNLLSVELHTDRDGVLWTGTPAADGAYAWTGALSEGKHELRVTVSDPEGNTSSLMGTVIVIQPPAPAPNNLPPHCAITSPEEGAYLPAGVPVRFEATWSDPDDDTNLMLPQWLEESGSAFGIQTPIEVMRPIGTQTVSFRVKDPHRAACTQTVTFHVGISPPSDSALPTDSGTPVDTATR